MLLHVWLVGYRRCKRAAPTFVNEGDGEREVFWLHVNRSEKVQQQVRKTIARGYLRRTVTVAVILVATQNSQIQSV